MRIRQIGQYRRSAGRWVFVVALLLTGAGCGPQQPGFLNWSQATLVWPKPPEQPRIAYLGALSTESDMEKRGSLLDGIGDLLFGAKPIGVLVSPYAVAVDPTGILYVADSAGAAVHAFNLRTRDYFQFSALGKEASLQKPVAVTTLGDRVYVVDSVLHEVCVFKRNGEFVFAFGQGQFQRPAGIGCRRPQGTLYIADTGNHAVYVFSHEGKFIRQIGTRGIGPGQFNFPTHLCVDGSGQLYVSDTLNYRVQVFGPDDEFLRVFGQQGDRPGSFAHPCGVAADQAGNIYVTDRQFENVQVFDPEGRILMAFGQEGSGPGEFWLPAGIFIDVYDRIYVADSYNKRVQVFEFLKEGGR
jgi:DNA-binding beta-propeller fold protein YncE